MKNLFKFIVVAIVILGLIMPLLNLSAQEIPSGKSELNELSNDLKTLKENDELEADEKENQEISLRKEALLAILNLSVAEAEKLIKTLESFELDGDQQEIQDHLIYRLQRHLNYYEKFKKELPANLSLADLKLLAKGFQIWRKSNYNKDLPLVSNFILLLNEQKILGVADARLEKIIADLNRLEESGLLEKQDFSSFLENAGADLKNAWALNKKAEQSIFNSKNQNDIKLLIQTSLKEIKNAYTEFLEISKKVKQLLS